jgi:hypothetical protein
MALPLLEPLPQQELTATTTTTITTTVATTTVTATTSVRANTRINIEVSVWTAGTKFAAVHYLMRPLLGP